MWTGYIARNLINFVERIDAVDFSQLMIEKGKSLPRGDHPCINWICGPVEEVSLHPPYALVTAGQSLHWMEWDVVLPHFKRILTLRGYIAIVDYEQLLTPWETELKKIIPRFSTHQLFQSYNLIEGLENRGLFQKQGEKLTLPILFRQSVEEYIESFHSRSGFSRERMSKEMVEAFDSEVKKLVSGYCRGGEFELQVSAKIVWGIPQNPLEDKDMRDKNG